MPVLTKVGDRTVDALDLDALYDALTPIVSKKIEERERGGDGRDELIAALMHSTALLFATHMKLGAINYERSKVGIGDIRVGWLADELALALGLELPDEEEGSQIVVSK